MRKRPRLYKNHIALLFGAIALISYLSVRFFPAEEEENLKVMSEAATEFMQVYLLDQEDTLIPLSIPIQESLDVEEKMMLALQYMSKENAITNFKPVLAPGSVCEKIEIIDRSAHLYFTETFLTYDAQKELRLLEALAWGMTQFEGVEQVQIFVVGDELTTMPIAHTPIPAILNRDVGINNFQTTASNLHESSSITVFYTKEINDVTYFVPATKRIPYNRVNYEQAVQEVLKDISISSNLNQPLSYERVELVATPELDGDTIILHLNDQMLDEERTAKKWAYESLVLSLSEMAGVEHVKIYVDDVVISIHGSNEEAISASSLSFNRIQL